MTVEKQFTDSSVWTLAQAKEPNPPKVRFAIVAIDEFGARKVTAETVVAC